MTSSNEFPRAGFRRRFGSWVYDVLIAFAVYMVAGAVSFLLFNMLIRFGVISMQGFEHAIDLQRSSIFYSILIYGWNIAWVSYFFIFFWAKSGQTLGMKAWRLRLQNQDGTRISKLTGLKRLIPTLLGLGNIAVIFDRKNKLSLQDRLTQTEVVVLSLEANRGRL
ncbi:MAG: RDD family protein [Colwellia sp.]|nr:RDD family protein [Colwellia sp.]MCW8863917.1 RDD family protein [Colwellia sp.]MCW9081199.1 RDD family protein [Colwellia sp.]